MTTPLCHQMLPKLMKQRMTTAPCAADRPELCFTIIRQGEDAP